MIKIVITMKVNLRKYKSNVDNHKHNVNKNDDHDNNIKVKIMMKITTRER